MRGLWPTIEKIGEKRTSHFKENVLIFYSMSPQALQLTPADIPSDTEFLVYSPEHGKISEHATEEQARASLANHLSEMEHGEYLPFLLKRAGEEWEIAEG